MFSKMIRFCVLLAFLSISNASDLLKDNKYDYKQVIKLSLLFFKAQRSGDLGDDFEIPWRGNSGMNDKGENGEDLTGGYYDGPGVVKFGFTTAFATTMLAWGVLLYKDAYILAGQYEEVLEAIKWSTDYFIKCHVSPYEFYGQVGSTESDTEFWGRPEDMNMSRPAYKITKKQPASDLVGETAAALAATSLVFKDRNLTYSQKVLKHATQLYDFAKRYRGVYHDVIPEIIHYFPSRGYFDELAWAAIWMYKATNNSQYIDEGKNFYKFFELNKRPDEFSYQEKDAGVQVLLAQETHEPEYLKAVKDFCDYTVDHQRRTLKGLVYIESFGTLSHAAHLAFICLQAAEMNINKEKYLKFAKSQIDYMLGAKTGMSYVVGYGERYPLRPHHYASSCPDRPAPCGEEQLSSFEPSPQILYGALVSGPNIEDTFDDVRSEYVYNDVTIYYNAAFQSTVAGLLYHTYLT